MNARIAYYRGCPGAPLAGETDMKIFISWSGDRSRAVAEFFGSWIKCVLQASRPWISTQDIDQGSIWFSEVNDQLKDTSIGVVFLTQENKAQPWILFESGALAKGLSSARVCIFLVDLQSKDVENPLAQLNHTIPDKQGVWRLVRTLNGCLGEYALDTKTVEAVFETYWPQFRQRYREILEENPYTEKIKARDDASIISEILEASRSLSRRFRIIEDNLRVSSSLNLNKNLLDVNNKDIKTKLESTKFTELSENERLELLNFYCQSVDQLVSVARMVGISKSSIDNFTGRISQGPGSDLGSSDASTDM